MAIPGRSRIGMVETLIIAFLAILSKHGIHGAKYPSLSCSLDEEKSERDPALKEMTFDVGDGPETFLAYVQPDVTTFYKDGPPASTAVIPKHEGLAGMWINLSNEPVLLYWEPFIGGAKSVIDALGPFDSGGTATFPSHSFFISSQAKPDTLLKRFKVGGYPDSVFVYDPYHVEGDEKQTKKNLKALTKQERESYRKLRKSVLFGEEYKKFTGRSYLANYPRPPPPHHMWRADHFNQTHWVTTRETHFETEPPASERAAISYHGKKRIIKDSQPRLLSKYRSKDPVMNMTMKVISCAPRVFEIKNFLSPVEVKHILDVAAGEDLSLSSTGIGTKDTVEDDVRRTRTSYNSWLERERSPIIDSIYRRASDLLRIDEALLRHRTDGERPDVSTKSTIAESLQLVHYDPNQEYVVATAAIVVRNRNKCIEYIYVRLTPFHLLITQM